MLTPLKQHWDHIYYTKQSTELSWTQTFPKTSLDFLHSLNLPKKARILDVGGGDGNLIDHLLAEGYENITVLDISEAAINRVKARLGSKASLVEWIVSDILDFHPSDQFDLWHDRATFHFLTTAPKINAYLDTAARFVKDYLILGTFSDLGPDRCSGLPIKKYSEPELEKQLSGRFTKIRCITEDHITPFHTRQNFLFCAFRRSPETAGSA
jgi:ubiquinone/menaquinone biosynthesis C-methylase UbiE